MSLLVPTLEDIYLGANLLDRETLHSTLFQNGCQFTAQEFSCSATSRTTGILKTSNFLAIGWLINDLIVTSFSVSLINNEVKHPFLFLLAICVFSLMRYLVSSFVPLSFSYLGFRSAL